MATEIERKFLLKNDAWRTEVQSALRISQGYLAVRPPVEKVRRPCTRW